MSRRKRRLPFVSEMFSQLAHEAGVEVHLEPQFGHVGQIICPNGKIHYFRRTHLDLNPIGAAELASDKHFAAYFMKRLGYSVIESQRFYSDERCQKIGSKLNIEAACRYAVRRLPVLIKPNSRSQGAGVSVAKTLEDFQQAAQAILERDPVMLVQKIVPGQDYRVVVLDEEVISAYERIPLNVIGNGRSTIQQLLRSKQRKFRANGREMEINLEDDRMHAKLSRSGLTLNSKLAEGEQVFLLDNANLSNGGDAVDVTACIHPGYKELAIRLTHHMGLRYCGVDLMVQDQIDKEPGKYWIIEINAAPGIDNYAAGGAEQKRIVEKLYLKVLEAIKRL